ncbi:MAG: hypothetical protein LBQ60_11435 [Bacteroidales bacterium]|jgi:hypothetical protein|nr:hypothetical protein [Bacteroidales bacterium]
MSKINFLAIFISVFTSSAIFAQDQYSYRGFDAPVSVTQYGGYFYLSNAGERDNRYVKNGNGYISRVKSDGSQENVTMKYITGLNSPHGICALQGKLYICDVDHVVGIDLQSKKKIFELNFSGEGTKQLTGIVAADNNTLYVSATDIDAIYKVDIGKQAFERWMETVSPTTMLINNNKMYVTSFGTDSLPNGKLGVIDMLKETYQQLGDYEGYLWGLALDGQKLYFCDWVTFGNRGVIRWLNLESGDSGQVKLTTRMGGPADFIYDSRNDVFIVPALLEGVVYGAIGFK